MRGVMPAQVLAMIESELERQGKCTRLGEYFDLICGTSTGAIIAIGMGLGMSARDIAQLYLDHAADIFPPRSMVRKLTRASRKKSFYDSRVLGTFLAEAYDKVAGQSPAVLGNAITRLCIPSYDIEHDEVHFFRNYKVSSAADDRNAPAKDVALASSSAPGMYSSHRFSFTTEGGDAVSYSRLIDGGTMVNTPTLIGYTEATRHLGVPESELAILSLGTGNCHFVNAPTDIFARYWFYFKDGVGKKAQTMQLVDLLLSSQASYTHAMMLQLQQGATPEQPRFVYERIQPVYENTQRLPIDAATPQQLNNMQQIGIRLFQECWNSRIAKFFQ